MVRSDLWLKAHILWIAGGLCIDWWFNGQIFRWWLRGCDCSSYLFSLFQIWFLGGWWFELAFGWLVVAGGGLHFQVISHAKHLKMFSL